MPAELEAVGFYRPAAGSEEGDGDLFSPESKELSFIFPFGGWDEAASARHSPR
jgi:hypothetical protein